MSIGTSRGAPASPGRPERMGVWGPTSVVSLAMSRGRHGFAGAARADGGLGANVGRVGRDVEGRHGFAGAPRADGGLGANVGRVGRGCRGAPRLRRGGPSGWGSGGKSRAGRGGG